MNAKDPFFTENRAETLRLFDPVRKGAGEDGENAGERDIKNGKGGESHVRRPFTPFFILRKMRY
jgi:hypothetical protein